MLTKYMAAVVFLPFSKVTGMLDPAEASIQARLMQLAHDEREVSTSLAGNAVVHPSMWGQSQFLAQTTGQRVPSMAAVVDLARPSPVVMHVESQQSASSFAQGAADPTKAPSGSGSCSPACKSGQGICVNNICLCHSPWSGQSCEVPEAVQDEVPFEKDAEKMVSPEIGEVLKSKVDMPFAIFIWSTLLVATFFCTALCPRLCCSHTSAQDDTAEYYDINFEALETQYDIVEAWAFDNRKTKERDVQNSSERRKWFEERIGRRLQQIKWPKNRH